MSRNNLFVVCLVGLLVCAVQPRLATGQETWEQYQRRLEAARREAANRHAAWVEERIKRNSEWRQTPGADDDRELELADAGLDPGRYTIRLPWGMGVRVVVPEGAAAAGGAWSERSYSDIYAYVRRINHQLGELTLELQRLGHRDLAVETRKIHEQAAQISSTIISRKPATEIKTQFTDFDKLWHPFSHRLQSDQKMDRTVHEAAAAIDQHDASVHQLLAILPAPAYDRPLVAALTSELAQATSHLLEDLKREQDESAEMRAWFVRAQRVRQHAADLDATVRANASLATIIEEYEEFDRTWHNLLERARIVPEIDAHVRRVAKSVRQIDQQLHATLYVDVPLVTDRQHLVNLSTSITRTAAHLADDLEADARPEDRDVVYEARLFTRVAQELNRALTSRQSSDVQQKAYRDFVGAWQRLKEQVDTLPQERYAHSLAIAVELGKDLQRLEAHFRAT